MPAYKGTKELPKASNKQARGMFTSMQKDREGMAKGRPDSVQRAEKDDAKVIRLNEKTQTVKPTPPKTQTVRLNEKRKYVKLDPSVMKKGGAVKKYAAGGVTKEMPSANQMGSMNMAKGGKAKAKPAAKGNPFAATKFGAAMMKKGADAKGRAMPKFAKGGSIDGCATKGKTKTTMVKMARGGKSC